MTNARQWIAKNLSSFLLILFFLFSFLFFIEDGKARVSRKKSRQAKIYKIDIQGHDKIKEDYIRSKISSKAGETYSIKKVREDVRVLFNTGNYYDIIVDQKTTQKGIELTYYLKEKPFILFIEYKGNVKIKQEDLEKASEVKNYEILSRTKLNQALKKIKSLYEEKGYFLAEVKYEIKEEESQKSVRVIFQITENDKVQVKRITFLGNQYFSDQKLKSVMFTKEDSFFSFLRKEQSYRQEAFERDIQALNFVYQNEGFVQVQILNPEVFITPDKKSIYITFKIEEGNRFRIGKIQFLGDLLFSKKHLRELIPVREGEYVSYQKLQEALKILQAEYGDLGYAFVNPIPGTFINEKEKKVNLSFNIEKGSKVYINEIHIFGNESTRDKVIRRELRIKEGELYHETRKRISEANIKRLGFFEEVVFLNKTFIEKPDQMDLEIRVKERSTGSLEVGLSYASQLSFQIYGSLSQNNFLGYGNLVKFSTSFNRLQQFFLIQFLDYYFLDTKWEFGVDLDLKKFDGLQEYFNGEKERFGGSIRIGRPIGNDWRFSLSYRLEKMILVWDPIWEKRNQKLFSGGLTHSLTGYLSYDRRDDRFLPSRGFYFLNSLEYAGFGGDLNFIKGSISAQYYQPVIWRVVWRNNLSYSFLHFNDPREDKYYSEMFRLGGPYNLRGYYYNSLGEVRRTINYPSGQLADEIRGGKQQILYQTELQALLVKESNIFGVFFYDAGMAEDQFSLKSAYANAGFGIRFLSPIGFLRFEWSFPLIKPPYRSLENYVFILTMGPPF